MRLGEAGRRGGSERTCCRVLPGRAQWSRGRFVTTDIRKIVFWVHQKSAEKVASGARKQSNHRRRWNWVARAPTSSSTTLRPGARRDDRAGRVLTLGRIAARSRSGAARRLTGLWSCSSRRYTALSSGTPDHAPPRWVPLVSRAHRDKVAGYVPDDAPVAFRVRRLGWARFGTAAVLALAATAPTKSSGRWL